MSVYAINVEAALHLIKIEGTHRPFVYRGYYCEIIRNQEPGNLCGYVTIKEKSNPIFSKYLEFNSYECLDLSVHGGITYGQINDSDELVLGFDCAHHGDMCPGWADKISSFGHGEYRTMDYVAEELENLVDQIIAYTGVLPKLNSEVVE